MVAKIDSGEILTEEELSDLRCYEIERKEGERSRWTMQVFSIIEMCGKYFMLNWDEGLTEMQENEFYKQPYEVKSHMYEKTITVTEWEPLKIEKVK